MSSKDEVVSSSSSSSSNDENVNKVDLTDANVVTKYKIAATIANLALTSSSA